MWLGDMPVPVPPSPNVHAQPTIVPSGSEEPEPLNAMLVPGDPLRSDPALATGGRFATVTMAVSPSVAPRLSVTVSVAV